MSSIIDFFNSLTLNAVQEIKSYVYYEKETGKIFKISSKETLIDNYEILEVPYSDVKELMSGKKRLDDFTVEYDSALKQLALKEHTFEDNFVSVSDKLYQIPMIEDEVDLRVINDRKNNYWKVILNPDLRKNKHLLQRPSRTNLHFSITAKNDPNILYNTFVVNLKELVDNDFIDIDSQFEFDPLYKEVSIYTAKFFETYSYEYIPNDK